MGKFTTRLVCRFLYLPKPTEFCTRIKHELKPIC
nr:MAG TPA: hypothetical protein [Caudoviricetes sp.]